MEQNASQNACVVSVPVERNSKLSRSQLRESLYIIKEVPQMIFISR